MSVQHIIEQIRLNDQTAIQPLRNYIHESVQDFMEIKPLENVIQSDRPCCWIIITSEMIDHDSNTQDLAYILQILNTMIDPNFDISRVYNVAPEFSLLMSKISFLATDLPDLNLLKPLCQLCMRLDPGRITPLHSCLLRLSIDTCHFYARKLLNVDELWVLDSRLQMSDSVSADFYLYSASILADSNDYYKASLHLLIGLNAMSRLDDHDLVSSQFDQDVSMEDSIRIPNEYSAIIDRLIITLLIEDENVNSLKQVETNESISGHRGAEYAFVGIENRKLVQHAKKRNSAEIEKVSKNSENQELIEQLRTRVLSNHILSFKSVFTSAKFERVFPQDDFIYSSKCDKDTINLLKELNDTKISDSSEMIWFDDESESNNRQLVEKLRKKVNEMVQIVKLSQKLAENEKITEFFLQKVFENRRNGMSRNPSDNMTPITDELRYNNRRRRKMTESTPLRLQKLRSFESSGNVNSEDDQIMESDDSRSD